MPDPRPRKSHRRAQLHRRHLHRRGFTLIECLIAGVIMAIFGSALASAVIQSGAANRRAEDRRAAAQWLDNVMTRIDMIGPARLAVEGPMSGELDERFSWSATYTEDPVLLNLYQIAVTITYREPDGRTAGTVVGYTQLHDPVGSRDAQLGWEQLSP